MHRTRFLYYSVRCVMNTLTISYLLCIFFFFNATATTEIYTLSLHDALPICHDRSVVDALDRLADDLEVLRILVGSLEDRKSTRLNSSHVEISYAVFCLKKKIQSQPLFKLLHAPTLAANIFNGRCLQFVDSRT